MTLIADDALAVDTPAKADVRSWKAPIALAIFAVLYAILILAAPRAGETTFRISTQADALQLPELVLPVVLTTWVVFALLVMLTVFAAVLVRGYKRTPLWLIAAYIIIAIVGFLTWAAAGEMIPVAGLLAGIELYQVGQLQAADSIATLMLKQRTQLSPVDERLLEWLSQDRDLFGCQIAGNVVRQCHSGRTDQDGQLCSHFIHFEELQEFPANVFAANIIVENDQVGLDPVNFAEIGVEEELREDLIVFSYEYFLKEREDIVGGRSSRIDQVF